MPCVISSIFEDCQLLPHFIQHYMGLGVVEFFFVINSHGQKALFEQVRAFSGAITGAGANINLCTHICTPKTDMEREMNQIRQKVVLPASYFIIADLDEFIEFPSPLPRLVEECLHGHYLFVRGYLVDRVTRDGSIPSQLGPDLWSQFPLAGSFSPHLHKGRTRKCVLQRGEMSISAGHHGPADGAGAHPQTAKVHHFKWCGDLVGRLTRRIATEQAKGFSYWRESEAVLRHLYARNGRLNVSLLKVASPGISET